ncbi:MAG: hypothetical protein ACOCWR_09690, partial [Oceanidesulfovibrio sp.]
MKAYIIYYSMYGHIHTMAQAARDAVHEMEGWTAELRRVPETLPDEVLEKMGALDGKKLMADVPRAEPADLEDADAIIFGTPTPRTSKVNLGVLKEDQVNILVHGHSPIVSETVLAAARDPELQARAKEAGASGINLVGLCCTGNELLMRQGI